MGFNKNQLAKYGLGLGLRRDLTDETLSFCVSSKNQALIEWLEIVPENFILRGAVLEDRFKRVLKSGVPLIPHGVNLSIGSDGWRDLALMRELKSLFTEINPPWFSDHISCTYIDGIYTQDLIPVPFTRQAARVITDNIKWLQDYFQLPFLIENPSYYTKLIEPEMSEAEFINIVLEHADCGMLLDVNNVYVNSVNHNYDAPKFISELDLDRVVQVHIAGHLEGYKSSLTGQSIAILDTHGEGIKTEVYDLLRLLLEHTDVNAILLERDSNFPDFSELIDELGVIRGIMNSASSQSVILSTANPVILSTKCERIPVLPANNASGDLANIQLEIKNYWQGGEPNLSKQAINELSIYKSLVISSTGDLLESVYPLCKQVPEKDWDNIVIQYLETYPSSSPVFNRAAERFPEFLRANKHTDWLCELAEYEWAELAVEIEPVNSTNNFRLLNFKYPISEIITNIDRHAANAARDDKACHNEAIQPSPEQILVYCDPETHHSKKLKLSTISALALTAILEGFSDEEGLESLTEILGLTKSDEIEKLKQEYLSFKNFIISNNITKAINYKPVAAT